MKEKLTAEAAKENISRRFKLASKVTGLLAFVGLGLGAASIHAEDAPAFPGLLIAGAAVPAAIVLENRNAAKKSERLIGQFRLDNDQPDTGTVISTVTVENGKLIENSEFDPETSHIGTSTVTNAVIIGAGSMSAGIMGSVLMEGSAVSGNELPIAFLAGVNGVIATYGVGSTAHNNQGSTRAFNKQIDNIEGNGTGITVV